MRKISDTAQSDSSSSLDDEDSTVENDFGWEKQVQESRKHDKNNKINVIKFANEKFPLSYFVKHINFEEKNSPSGWTHRTPCPFPDHDDSSPSFFYNPKDGKFKCFGCDRYGKSVEFVSYLKKITKSAAAELIIGKYSAVDFNSVDETVNQANEAEIDVLLKNFSDRIREYLIKKPDSLEFVEQLTWVLDMYLYKHVPNKSLNKDMLENRINALFKKLI